MSSVGVVGDWSTLDDGGAIVVAVSGSVANALFALIGWLLLRRDAGRPGYRTVLGWLFVYLGLWPIVGYALLSPMVGPDDWMIVLDRFPNRGTLRATIMITGLFAAGAVSRAMSANLARVIGNGLAADRKRRARHLVWIAWITSAALVSVAAIVGGHGPWIRGVAAVAVVACSTVPMLWAAEEVGRIPVPGEALTGARSNALILVGLAAAVVFVTVLGPGIAVGG